MEIEEDEKSPVTSVKDGTVLDGNLAGKSSALRKAGINFWIDALAFLTFLITTVSGMALMRIRPDEYDTQVGLLNEQLVWGISHFEWLHLHNLIGWIFVALVAVHLVMHWRWVASMLSRWLSSNRRAGTNERLIRIDIPRR